MTMGFSKELINIGIFSREYLDWFRDEINYHKLDNEVQITLPYLDYNNDYIQIYLKHFQKDIFLLSDNGITVNNLLINGYDLMEKKYEDLLKTALNMASIDFEKKVFLIKSTYNDLPSSMHFLIQTIFLINNCIVFI